MGLLDFLIASAQAAPPAPQGGLLGQAGQNIQNYKQQLDDPTKSVPPAVQPPPKLDPKLIRPDFQKNYAPEEWTKAEHDAFAKANNITKPSIWQQLFSK
jgi:hypothetical protein